jgi:hypothetical protein
MALGFDLNRTVLLMANEVVITSVPRGVKLGRTGFQVVMRTAGVSDGMLASLEQLAGYRHVFPQGSGRNPLIYSYRAVRSPAGELRVLGRTVDAGNDFSNRSNKLAHLLALEPGESNALRNSSPAAVLAAIDSQLLQAWQGGPEERPSSLALSVVPTEATPCTRWRDVKGDAGWGGLLAQRAINGQPSLIVAPDCSPVWSRRLLDLFQEVLALLPPDSRWKTTFETTVIGASSSILRGTYAGSPESAAGRQGLLVVELSHKSRLPETASDHELITLAREGRAKSMAGAAPTRPNLPGPPALPRSDLEEQLGTRLAEPGRPLKAPVSWGDDNEDVPRSRLGWFIGGGMVLLGAVLVSALLVGWHFFDDYTTKKLRREIEDFAAIADDNDPGAEKTPTLEDWKRAFREDDTAIHPDSVGFQVVLSALASKQVGASYVQEEAKRNAFLRAAHAIALANPDKATILEHARNLGLTLRDDLDEAHRNALALLVSTWLAADHPYRKGTPPRGLDVLQERFGLATEFVNAALAQPDDPWRSPALARAANRIWPDATGDADRGRWLEDFAANLDPNGMAFTVVSGVLDDARKRNRLVPTVIPPSKDVPPLVDGSDAERKAFEDLKKEVSRYERRRPEKDESVILASGIEAKDLRLSVSLPSCGNWKPTVTPNAQDRPTQWQLSGTPDDPTAAWGTLSLDPKSRQLVFKPTILGDRKCRTDTLYIPMRFTSGSAPSDESCKVILANEEKLRFAATENDCLADLIDTGSSMLVADGPSVSFAIAMNTPEALVMSLAATETSGLRLEAGPMESGGLAVNVLAVAADPSVDSESSLRDVLIESFKVAPADDNGYLAFTVTRVHAKEHPWRASPESPVTLATGKCSEDTWRELVQQILNASTFRDLQDVRGKKLNLFIEQLLGGKATNKQEREAHIRQINALHNGGIRAWHNKNCGFLFHSQGAYHSFTADAVARQQGDRPPNILEPATLPDNALESAKREHRARLEALKEAKRLWDQRFEEQLRSSLNLISFLEQTSGKDDADSVFPYRAAGVVVLELSARIAEEQARNAMQKVALPSLFTAQITLPWVFSDDTECPVHRLTIEPAADRVPAGTPTAIPAP